MLYNLRLRDFNINSLSSILAKLNEINGYLFFIISMCVLLFFFYLLVIVEVVFFWFQIFLYATEYENIKSFLVSLGMLTLKLIFGHSQSGMNPNSE